MSAWYLWDGVEQQGPMDAGELKARIRSHPNRAAILVWTRGQAEWKRPEDVLGPAFAEIPVPPPLPPRALAPERPKRQNFIARHWRGEYPLWVSYWVVGLFSNMAALLAIVLLSQFMVTQVAYVPFALWLFFVTIWSGLVELAIWQGVGIWRSASRRHLELRAAGKRAFWPGMAKVAVCLGALQLGGVLVKAALPQIVEATRMAFLGDPSIPSYTVRAINGTEAEIAGGIKYGVTTDLEKLLNAQPGVRVVHLDSVGGRIGEGKKLNALIRERQLDTYVETKCMSACTLVFAGGRERILGKGAALGFHRGAFPGGQSDDVGSSVERQIYAAAGFSKAFIDRALATPNADMWKPTAAELLSYKVVTRLSDGDEFAIGGLGALTTEEWDKALLKATPAYGAVKQKYPADYAEIVDIFVKEAARGTPRAAVVAKARAKFNELIKNLLPQADDAVLIEFSRLAMDEYRALQAQDPYACYKYAVGTDVGEDIIRMIPPDLVRRETSLHEKIILSAQKRDKAPGTEASWTRIRDNLLRKGYSNAELQAMGDKTIPPSSQARYCAATIDLYNEITSLPATEASVVLREMYSDG
ncbi:MAG: DUF4339 domain-containing protein [Bradyrhizobium sp.]|nr:DUF4339 domain-containing protein [Bradyrhizobium sp.]